MSSVALSPTANLIAAATASLVDRGNWPDTLGGLAHRILRSSVVPLPTFMQAISPLPPETLLRRSPDLAAYGYLLKEINTDDGNATWERSFDHLRGREIYPSDRQSFVHDPVELLGIAFGVSELQNPGDRAQWLTATLSEGLSSGKFATAMTTLAANAAVTLLQPSLSANISFDELQLTTSDLLLAASIHLVLPNFAPLRDAQLPTAIVARSLHSAIRVNDISEAATVWVCAHRVSDELILSPSGSAVPLCLLRRCVSGFHFSQNSWHPDNTNATRSSSMTNTMCRTHSTPSCVFTSMTCGLRSTRQATRRKIRAWTSFCPLIALSSKRR